MAITRATLKKEIDANHINIKRNGGVDQLPNQEKEAANNLFEQLEAYGLFTVRKGELESWLPHLNATGHGPSWLIDVFEKMGEDQSSASYLKPEKGDVWDFIKNIKNWIDNPNRLGISN